jgi:hypothetical protein
LQCVLSICGGPPTDAQHLNTAVNNYKAYLMHIVLWSGFATYVSYIGAEEIDPANYPWGRMIIDETFYVSSHSFPFKFCNICSSNIPALLDAC